MSHWSKETANEVGNRLSFVKVSLVFAVGKQPELQHTDTLCCLSSAPLSVSVSCSGDIPRRLSSGYR